MRTLAQSCCVWKFFPLSLVLCRKEQGLVGKDYEPMDGHDRSNYCVTVLERHVGFHKRSGGRASNPRYPHRTTHRIRHFARIRQQSVTVSQAEWLAGGVILRRFLGGVMCVKKKAMLVSALLLPCGLPALGLLMLWSALKRLRGDS